MPFPLIPLAIGGLSALSGLFGNRGSTSTQQQTQDTNSTTNSTQNVDLSNMPQYTPEMASLRDYILNALRNRAQSSTDLSGYQTTGLQTINQGADLKRRLMDNILASRGLSNSPAGANAIGRVESGRIGEQINFLNQIPLLQRQLQGEDLTNFGNFFSRLPVGNRQTGTTTVNSNTVGHMTGSGQVTQPGNMLGGLFSGLGSGLAYMFGAGAFGNGNKPSSTPSPWMPQLNNDWLNESAKTGLSKWGL